MWVMEAHYQRWMTVWKAEEEEARENPYAAKAVAQEEATVQEKGAAQAGAQEEAAESDKVSTEEEKEAEGEKKMPAVEDQEQLALDVRYDDPAYDSDYHDEEVLEAHRAEQ